MGKVVQCGIDIALRHFIAFGSCCHGFELSFQETNGGFGMAHIPSLRVWITLELPVVAMGKLAKSGRRVLSGPT